MAFSAACSPLRGSLLVSLTSLIMKENSALKMLRETTEKVHAASLAPCICECSVEYLGIVLSNVRTDSNDVGIVSDYI